MGLGDAPLEVGPDITDLGSSKSVRPSSLLSTTEAAPLCGDAPRGLRVPCCQIMPEVVEEYTMGRADAPRAFGPVIIDLGSSKSVRLSSLLSTIDPATLCGDAPRELRAP